MRDLLKKIDELSGSPIDDRTLYRIVAAGDTAVDRLPSNPGARLAIYRIYASGLQCDRVSIEPNLWEILVLMPIVDTPEETSNWLNQQLRNGLELSIGKAAGLGKALGRINDPCVGIVHNHPSFNGDHLLDRLVVKR